MNNREDLATQQPGPLVSVVMPTHGMGAFIAAALGSVAAQTYTNWEVLVVDDRGPEDGTLGIVQGFAERWGGARVRLIRHVTNQGVSAARNTGITEARGEFVAFLDPDDLWLPVHLARLLALFHRGKDLDVASGPVELFWEGPGAAAPRLHAIAPWQRRYFPHSLSFSNFIQPSASLVRRSVLLELGGFDTDPAIQHIEDYDLWLRLVEKGSRFAFLEEHTSRYRKHAGAATADQARMNRLHDLLYVKHAAFFRAANAHLWWSLMDRLEVVKAEVGQINIERHGPLLRTILFLDEGMRRLVRSLRGKG
jgi:glycosyltransferase involved in cell wall biosynthesis